MFALPPNKRNDLYTPVPYGWEQKSCRFLGVSTPVMFSYWADHLHISGSIVRELLGRIVEVKTELTTRLAFLWTVCHRVVSRLALDDMSHVCGEGGVLIRVSQDMIRKRFEMNTICVLRRMHCDPLLAPLPNACLVEAHMYFTAAKGCRLITNERGYFNISSLLSEA